MFESPEEELLFCLSLHITLIYKHQSHQTWGQQPQLQTMNSGSMSLRSFPFAIFIQHQDRPALPDFYTPESKIDCHLLNCTMHYTCMQYGTMHLHLLLFFSLIYSVLCLILSPVCMCRNIKLREQ